MGSTVGSNRRRRRTFWLFGLLVGLPVVLVIGWSVLHFGLYLLFSEFEGPPSLEAEEAGTVVLSADEPVAVRRIVVEAMYPVPLNESLEPSVDLSVVLPGWVPQPEGVEDVGHMIVREADGQVLGGDHQFFADLRCPTPPCTASYLAVFRLMEGLAAGSAEFDWRASARLTLPSEDTEEADLQIAVEEMPVDDVRFSSLGPAEEFSLNPSAPLLARHVVVRVGSDVVPESGFNQWPVFADLDDEPTVLNPNPDNSWFRPMIRRIQPDLSGGFPWSICQPGLPCEFEYTAVIFYNDGPTHIDSGIESNPATLEVAWRPGILLDFLQRNPPTSVEVAVVSVDHATLPGGFLTHRVAGEVELGQAGGIQYRTIEITFDLPEGSPMELPVLLGGLVTARAHRADGSSRTPPFFFQVGGEGMMVNGGGRLISDGVTAYTMAIPGARCLPGSSCTLTFELAIRKDEQSDPDVIVVWSLDLHVGFFDVNSPPEGVIFDAEVTETVEP